MKKAVILFGVISLSLLTALTGYGSVSDADIYGMESNEIMDEMQKAPGSDESVIYIKTEQKRQEEEVETAEPEYAGEFSIAAYCGCELCCGTENKIRTYFGTPLTANHTIAADFNLFSPGDRLLIDGTCYTVEDRASSNSPDQLLIYFDIHSDAVEFGRKMLEVYRIPEEELSMEGEPLGEFIITGYCGCEVCTGIYSEDHMTFSGTEPFPNHTVAADPDIVPLNTMLLIDGEVYTVEDTGKSIIGRRLDIYFESHEEAITYGRRKEKVYRVESTAQDG